MEELTDCIGKFDSLNNEYVIKDMFPKRELLNYLWNDDTLCVVNQFFGGQCWTFNRTSNKRTYIDKGERNIYVKDNKTGEVVCLNRNYGKLKFDLFECRVGLGYQKIFAEYKGIKLEYILTLPKEGQVLLYDIKLSNVSKKKKDLSIYFYCQPTPNEETEDGYTEGIKAETFNGIEYLHDSYNKADYTRYFISSNLNSDYYAVANEDFIGVYSNSANPDGVKKSNLNSTGKNFENNFVGALQFNIILNKSETWGNNIACGVALNEEDCVYKARKYCLTEFFNQAINSQKELNNEMLDVFRVNSPDEIFNAQTNVWLKRQLSLGKDWGRVYGKGFRDVMQDIASFVSLSVKTARQRIVDVLKWQYEDGNPIRMFEPCYYYPYNDCASWIPATVLGYLNESGDLSILDEKVAYIKGTSKENSGYNKPSSYTPHNPTDYKESVFDHVKKAIDYLYSSRGEHGLILFLGGDWNDSLNAVGKQGKGESVWLSLATIKATNEFTEILNIVGKTELTEKYKILQNGLKESVIKYGFSGKHLIYGYNDYGDKIGADENEYGKIFLNPQTWAVLSNVVDKEQLCEIMDEVEARLSCDFGYVQCVPCYKKGDEKLGRITYFKNGIVENGAVYNHGVAFKIVADCMLKRADNAYQTALKIRFDNPKNINNGMEPYAVSNFYIGPENKYNSGYAPMSWITGTAGWLYRAFTEYICGIKPSFNGLIIEPCLPTEWNELSVKRIFRNNIYDIKFRRTGENGIYINGKKIKGNLIEYSESETKEYNIEVTY